MTVSARVRIYICIYRGVGLAFVGRCGLFVVVCLGCCFLKWEEGESKRRRFEEGVYRGLLVAA